MPNAHGGGTRGRPTSSPSCLTTSSGFGLWVQDWTGERNFDGGYGVQYRWGADATRYPDLHGMIAELRGRGFRFLSHANPFIVPGLEHFDAMPAGNMLVKKADGTVYEHAAPNGKAATPDFTNPATYDYVRGAFRSMFEGLGIDGMMAEVWVGDQETDFSPHDGLPTAPICAHPERGGVDTHRSRRVLPDHSTRAGSFEPRRATEMALRRVSMIRRSAPRRCTPPSFLGP